MNPKKKIFEFNSYWLIVIGILCIPALLINLGSLAFIEDEAIRSIVALEMLDTKNFLVPTINGDFYYAKPPLYNWILALSFTLFGQANEWAARLPNILILLLFTWTIYKFTKPHLGNTWAFFNAFFFLTCGRLLFWDSFLCLIDISYSLVTYTSIICIYYFSNDRLKQTLSVYGLSGVAYLMKGFPSLLFPAISFAAYYIWKKNWKGFFHWSHLVGWALLAIIIGSYYFAYAQHNPLDRAIDSLLDQSTRRTIMKHSVKDVFLHLFSYPFENIYHFLPWSLLTLLLLKLKQVKEAIKNPFIAFNAIMFLSNIIVYWVSPGVYPRYILMLVPLYFTFFTYLLKKHYELKEFAFRLSNGFSIFFLSLTLIGLIGSLFNHEVQQIPNYIIWSVIVAIGIIGLLYLQIRHSVMAPIILISSLLLTRIWFNTVMIPTRVNSDFGSKVRSDAQRVARTYPDLKLYGKSKMDRTSSFYLAAEKMQANQRSTELSDGHAFVYDTISFRNQRLDYVIIDSLDIREYRRKAYIIKENK